MKLKILTVGLMATDCYILWNDEKKDPETGRFPGIVVDPGDDAPAIAAFLSQAMIDPAAILLTHGHFDHIGAVEELKKRYDLPVVAGIHEAEVLLNSAWNLSSMFTGNRISMTADRLVSDGELLQIPTEDPAFSFTVLETPGHTIGGVCYYLADCGILFSGDTLFEGSYGRTDFPTGSGSALFMSIREKLMTLPEDTQVFPGHGASTTILNEKPLFI